MAGLTRNPDDELLRVIRSLESRVRTLETQRSRPYVGGQAGIDYSSGFTPNVWNTVTLDSVVYDSGGVVDTANNRLHAPSSGAYLILVGGGYIYSNGTYVSMVYRVNGTPVVGGSVSADDPSGLGMPTITDTQAHLARLNAGDYVDFAVNGDGAPMGSTGPYQVGMIRLHDL